jgi:SAM-dependent methyltransferase
MARHDRSVAATSDLRPHGTPCGHHPRVTDSGALDFSASGHLYATHTLHAFAARCPPPLARWAIETFTDPGDYVLDVMCGSGTTLVECLLTGRHGLGVDIDPLARLITSAKATPLPVAQVTGLADDVERALEKDLDDRWRPDLPRLTYWFRPEVLRDLARVRAAILMTSTAGSALQRLAWTVYSSLIVARTSVANARDLVHSRHHYRAWTEDPDVPVRFLRQLRRAATLLSELNDAVGQLDRSYAARVVGEDARRIPLADDSIDLAFFSPPYVSALDYPRAHMFSVAWLSDVLGVSVAEYRTRARGYVGSDRSPLAEATRDHPLPPASDYDCVTDVARRLAHSPGKAWVVHRYFRDMANVLREASRLTRPGGHVVIVVCPSNIRRVPIPTHQLFAQMAPLASDGCLEVEDMYERTIHDHRRVMPYLEAAFGERMRTEYVLVLRRGPRVRPRTNGEAR